MCSTRPHSRSRSAANVVGNTGRNEFTGPGLYNVDFSLARSFSVPHLGESTRFTIRADAFNILNHANLNNPDNLVGDIMRNCLREGNNVRRPSAWPHTAARARLRDSRLFRR